MNARTILLGAALLTSAVTTGEEKPTLTHPDILWHCSKVSGNEVLI